MIEIFEKGIIFESFDDAMNVHKQLFQMLRESGSVTCADLCYLIVDDEYTSIHESYCTHGWTNLTEAKVEPYEKSGKEYWILKLPKVKILK